jgi:hypothetical protein
MANITINQLPEATTALPTDPLLFGKDAQLNRLTIANLVNAFATLSATFAALNLTGQSSFGGLMFEFQPTPDTVSTTGTLSAANLQKRILISSPAAAITLTLPTGTTLETVGTIATDRAFLFTIVNTSANAITVAANTGVTIVGAATVAANTSATYIIRKTALNTFVAYRA